MAKTKTVEKTKSTTKETKPIVKEVKQELESISATIVGNTIIAKVGKKKYSIKSATEAQKKSISKKIEMYQKRPTEKAKDEIIALLSPTTTEEKKKKEVAEAKTKGIKQQIKKEEKKTKKDESVVEARDLMADLEAMLSSSPEAVVKLETLINKFKKVEEKAPVAVATKKPWRGEGYRE